MASKLPPLAVLLLAAALIWIVHRLSPPLPAFPAREWVAGLLALAGAAVALLGVISFRRAGTTVNPLNPERVSALVVRGIYRYSRNPMYLGFALLLAAWLVYLSAWLALPVLPAFILSMNRFQIEPEEKVLEARFGAVYLEYKERVRRWL
jgi:protein-S-isoprenylcysteine O-methyltransferase Ste14